MKSIQVFILAISCLPLGLYANNIQQHGIQNEWSSALRLMFRTYKQCQQHEADLQWPCLKQRALTLIERAISMDAIPIVDGISVERDSPRASVEKSEEANLPTDPQARSAKLDDLLWDRVTSFLKSHSLRLKLPTDLSIEEGRGKLKKIAGPIVLGLMMKGMLAALGLGALALLAGKALLVSKLALALSIIVAAKKLFGGGGGGGGGHHDTYEIVSKHPHHHDGSASNHVPSVAEPNPTGYFGHRRSLLLTAITPSSTQASDIITSSQPALDFNNNNYTTEDFAQMMAYRAYRQSDPTVPTKS